MAGSITSRRPSDPSRLEIEARKAYLRERSGEPLPERDYLAEVNGLLLEQCDDEEDYRLPESGLAPVPNPIHEPREMSKADRCNVDVSSLFLLNLIPDTLPDRYKLGAIDPETMDLGGDSLAEIQEATAKPIAFKLKTEIQTHRDVTAFRSKRR